MKELLNEIYENVDIKACSKDIKKLHIFSTFPKLFSKKTLLISFILFIILIIFIPLSFRRKNKTLTIKGNAYISLLNLNKNFSNKNNLIVK